MNVKQSLSPYYRRDAFEHIGGLQALSDEHSYWIENQDIQGEIPDEVRGTLYRIGPGRNQIGDQVYGHWFDGDGMVHAISFTERGVWYRNRYVRTPKYQAETAQNKILYRGFGTNRSGGVLANIGRMPENAANTHLMFHAGKLFALWEGGRPWQIDPVSLRTYGEYTFNNRLGKLDAFSAHGKICPKSSTYYNHGVGVGQHGVQLNVYKINAQGDLIHRNHFKLPFAAFVHDFSFAGDYLVYWIHPLGVKNPLPYVLGTATLSDCVKYEPKWGMHALIVCAKTLKEVKRIQLDPCVIVHTGNAWCEGDEIVLNVVRFEHFKVNQWLSNVLATDIVFDADTLNGGLVYQYRLNQQTGQYQHTQIVSGQPTEFPQWDLRYSGQKTRYQYSIANIDRGYEGSVFFNAIQKFDDVTAEITLHVMPEGQFISEVLFMPTGQQEGQGYLGAVVYDAYRHLSDVVIFESTGQMQEIARIPLKNHVPFGFHGGYTTQSFWD